MSSPAPVLAPALDPASALEAPLAAPVVAPPVWSLFQRVAFRFCFAYLALVLLPGPLGWVPGLRWVGEGVLAVWTRLVPWVGAHVLRLSEPVVYAPNGSGDTLFEWVKAATALGLAALVTVGWSLLAAQATHHARAWRTLHVFVRYALGSVLLAYGFVKVFKSQFPLPAPERLLQPVGELSPMGLAWTFMGYSPGYNVFTGGAEVLAGLLLLFRRTTTVGALLAIAVMTNVVALNVFFDVAVKLYSMHLVLLAVLVLAPDLRRVVDVLLLGRAAPAAPLVPYFTDVRWVWAARVVKAVTVGVLVLGPAWRGYQGMTTYGDAAPRPPLWGAWEVVSFERDGQVVPPLLTDAKHWRKVALNNWGVLTVRRMDDSVVRLRATSSAVRRTLEVSATEPERFKATWTWTEVDAAHVELAASHEGQVLRVRLRRLDLEKTQLLSRGFHWVSPAPFNR